GLSSIDRELMYKLKRKGFSDARLAKLLGVTEKNLRSHRHKLKVLPVYKRVDTCAAEDHDLLAARRVGLALFLVGRIHVGGVGG
ncbi:hypothetical protein, partial [Pseudomonas aeruginosa]|uniref:hypothetical protein n=1 Tax=Pseudomonas aeruginosa TaxID=287 RepID=UPI001E45D6CE